MVYPYYCEHCDLEFDVTKSMHESSREERCIHCGKVMTRVYLPPVGGRTDSSKVDYSGYNPAFGQHVKNKRHAQELAKRKGMVEIGNEKVETVHKHFDSERELRRKKRWSDA